ncbi:MAG: Lrp/AsnC family transcriptional regulator [Thermoleophilia bacterium]|nr:Lrp/AsnC family transcriptional regulator [Thermoleophilia bacterium]
MDKALSDSEKALVRHLQDDIPLSARPFAEIGEAVGMSEDEVVEKIREWQENGTIRRFGAMVRHQRLGYRANAMSAWDIPDERAEEVGRILAAADEVSHCYQRPRANGWSYNLFAMIHGASEEECDQVAAGLAGQVGVKSYALLFSSREFKKVSMRYFIE